MARPGLVDIVPGPDEHTGLTRVSTSHAPAATRVRGDTLTNLLTDDEIAAAKVVKIDVEGAEFGVIAGLAEQLDRFADACEFVVEVGPDRGTRREVDDLIETFTKAGYTPYHLPNFYDVRSYMLEAVATSLPRIDVPPTTEVDVVFSRQAGGGEVLPM